MKTSSGLPEGFDAADAELAGWSDKQLKDFLATAELFQADSEVKASSLSDRKERKPRQADALVSLVEGAGVELWTDADGEPYSTIPINDHFENWPLRSKEFRRWLAGKHYLATGGAIGGQAMEDSIRVLEAKAAIEGKTYETFRRVGAAEGKIYLDRCDPEWRAVAIRSDGWQTVARAACKFIRGAAMRALPEPEAGSSINELRSFVNVESDADFMLIVGWLVGALRPQGPYSILVVNGEQGSGKSILSRVLREITDPNASPLRSAPEKERDLFVAAHNAWVMAIDNLSFISDTMSDVYCRISTGGGFSVRTLHSDKEETYFEICRPIIFNGIPQVTNRADLSDRGITVILRNIPEAERRTEAQFWAEYELAKPRILGALLDAVCSSLRNLDKVKLEKLPRMADFALWVTAAEAGLGWERGSFVQALFDNKREMSASNFEADQVAVAIDALVRVRPESRFEGTVSELHVLLNDSVTEGVRKSRRWPDSVGSLGSRLRRMAGVLRARGLVVEFRHSGIRTVMISAPGPDVPA